MSRLEVVALVEAAAGAGGGAVGAGVCAIAEVAGMAWLSWPWLVRSSSVRALLADEAGFAS